MKAIKQATLTFAHIVSDANGVRSSFDQRHRVRRVIASYRGDDGFEYRKSFEAKGRAPHIPQRGLNLDITKQSKQW